jgi:hypothetical protein
MLSRKDEAMKTTPIDAVTHQTQTRRHSSSKRCGLTTAETVLDDRETRVGLVTNSKWLGKDEHGLANRHFDKKLRSDLNCPESLKMSELRLKTPAIRRLPS